MLSVHETSIRVFPVWQEIAATGMPASRDYFETLYDDLTDQMNSTADYLSTNYFDGRPINPAPNTKDSETLVASLNLPNPEYTPKGHLKTGKDVIEQYRYKRKDIPKRTTDAVSKLFQYRELMKVRGTYCRAILDSMPTKAENSSRDIYDVMGLLKITRVPSRRPSMEKAHGINLLNVSSRQNPDMLPGLSSVVKKGFVAPQGQMLGAWDLSQIELRVGAHLSGDEFLCRVYNEGADLHAEMAHRLFDVPPERQEVALHRIPAKTTNFLMLFGGSGHALYQKFLQLGLSGWSVRKCDKLIKSWYEVCDGVRRWKIRTINKFRHDGIARDEFGMPRYLPGLWSNDIDTRQAAERESISQLVQGTAQGMIQNSMGWIHERLVVLRETSDWYVHCALQLYDELIYRFDPTIWCVLNDIVLEGLTVHHGLGKMRVPIVAEGNYGQRWSDLK